MKTTKTSFAKIISAMIVVSMIVAFVPFFRMPSGGTLFGDSAAYAADEKLAQPLTFYGEDAFSIFLLPESLEGTLENYDPDQLDTMFDNYKHQLEENIEEYRNELEWAEEDWEKGMLQQRISECEAQLAALDEPGAFEAFAASKKKEISDALLSAQSSIFEKNSECNLSYVIFDHNSSVPDSGWVDFSLLGEFDGTNYDSSKIVVPKGKAIAFRINSGHDCLINYGSRDMHFYFFDPLNGYDESCSIYGEGNIMSLLYHDFAAADSLNNMSEVFLEFFQDCKSLKSAPLLPATALSYHCYGNMFKSSGIVSAPELPAMTLTNSCYHWMFYDCTALSSAPKLEAMELAESCYESMFWNCVSLKTFSQDTLPARTVYKRSYCGMFKDCSNLEKAPEIMAVNSPQGAYQAMFMGASKINEVKVHFTSWGNNYNAACEVNAAGNKKECWLNKVSAAGKLICPSTLDTTVKGDYTVPSGWTVETFTVSEAKIGNTEYASLKEALGNAQKGDTVILLEDVNFAEDYTVYSLGGITLDLGSHCIGQSGQKTVNIRFCGLPDSPLMVKGDSKNKNFKDAIVSFSDADLKNVILDSNLGGDNLVLENVTSNRMFTGSNTKIFGGSFFTVEFGNNISISDDAYVNWLASDNVLVYGATVDANDMQGGTIYGGRFKNDPSAFAAATSTVSGPGEDGYYIVTPADSNKFDYCANITSSNGGWIVKITVPNGEAATITSVQKGISFSENVLDGFSGDTFTVAKSLTKEDEVTGRPVYGDLYKINYTTNKSNSGSICVNLRVVENVASVIDTTKLEDALVKAYGLFTSNLSGNYTRTAEVEHIVTVGSIGSKDNLGDIMGVAPELISAFKQAYSDAQSIYASRPSQAEVIAAANTLEDAVASLYKGFDTNFIRFSAENDQAAASDGKTVTFALDGLSVSYAKGIFKSKPANAVDVTENKLTLSNGVYTFFVQGKYFIMNMSQTYYVVVGQNEGVTTVDSLVQAVKDTVAAQTSAASSEIFTEETTDLQALINMGFAYIAAQESPVNPPSVDPQPQEPINNPTFSSYVTLTAKEDGTFEWSAKNGATILGMSYATGIDNSKQDTAEFYPVVSGKNIAHAMKSQTVHTFKAVVSVCGKVEVYYANFESPKCDTPAVTVLSSALGVFKRGADVAKAAYIKGSFASIEDTEQSNETIYYIPVTDEGVMLDKSVFDNTEYTFFFFNNSGEYVSQVVRP